MAVKEQTKNTTSDEEYLRGRFLYHFLFLLIFYDGDDDNEVPASTVEDDDNQVDYKRGRVKEILKLKETAFAVTAAVVNAVFIFDYFSCEWVMSW